MSKPLTQPTVAVIDLGSNSIKLLVARRDVVGGGVVPLLNAVRETRVSAGISASRPAICADAFAVGLQSVRELYETAQPFQPAAFRLVATSAVRDASNGSEFMQDIHSQTGLVGEILSGEQEARAIARGIACDPALQDKSDFFQMDLGGGSFEFVRISNGVAETAISLQLGAVRMLERFVSDPQAAIPQVQREALREHVQAELKASGFHFEPVHAPLIATGGAFTVARICLGAPLDGMLENTSPILSRRAFAELADRLSAMPLSIREQTPFIPRQRADILPVALDTIVAAMDHAGRDYCQHSLCNLRFGIAAEMLDAVVWQSGNYL